MSLFANSYEKALERKDQYAVSGSAGVSLSSCGRSLTSEGSNSIQQQRNDTLRPNTTAAGSIIQPSLAKTSKSRRPITPSSDQESDSALENSEGREAIKAGPIPRPLHRQPVEQLTSIPPLQSTGRTFQKQEAHPTRRPQITKLNVTIEQRDPEQRSPFQKFVVRMLRSINDLSS
ncbi:hypothetical protein DAPPUDRAFT_108375 [Daphnia pulex]|uniref:Uncharacterized protein n=1 Tax=Daphnia pulex TaxID=6669 RepID=E9H003_DAPPU|nr:hypothetical protein DAPPUDRAFT_108375 [Daphnia pulex]|eukprot:EFX74970.1 hypothetical protein DAPPUDRAFT_108375 [Daphnia pulex]